MASVVRPAIPPARRVASRVETRSAVRLTTASIPKELAMGLRTMASEVTDALTGRRIEAATEKLEDALEALMESNRNALDLLDMIEASLLNEPTALERMTASADRLDAALERMTALAAKVEEIDARTTAFDPNRLVPDRMMIESTANAWVKVPETTAKRSKDA